MNNPAFQFYPAEFLADLNVERMSLDEKGAYILLICYCWREGGIPNDMEVLSRLCRCSQEQMEHMWKHLKPCFKPCKKNENFLIHPRLEIERKKQKNFKKSKSDAGKKGAKAKWDKAKSDDGTAMILPMAKNSSLSSSLSLSSCNRSAKADHPPKSYRYSEDEFAAAKFIFEKIREKVPNLKQPNLEKWANEVRLMVEQDKHSVDEIKSLFEWASNHAFWQSVILSPTKLREKWIPLTLRRSGEAQPSSVERNQRIADRSQFTGGEVQL